MSSQPEPTKKQSTDASDALLAEQQALTTALAQHPDPHVRIMAHISERQLALHELLTSIRQEMRDGFTFLNGKIDGLSGRQDTLESRYSNGAGHDAVPVDTQ